MRSTVTRLLSLALLSGLLSACPQNAEIAGGSAPASGVLGGRDSPDVAAASPDVLGPKPEADAYDPQLSKKKDRDPNANPLEGVEYRTPEAMKREEPDVRYRVYRAPDVLLALDKSHAPVIETYSPEPLDLDFRVQALPKGETEWRDLEEGERIRFVFDADKTPGSHYCDALVTSLKNETANLRLSKKIPEPGVLNIVRMADPAPTDPSHDCAKIDGWAYAPALESAKTPPIGQLYWSDKKPPETSRPTGPILIPEK